jgi:hypothetical protein
MRNEARLGCSIRACVAIRQLPVEAKKPFGAMQSIRRLLRLFVRWIIFPRFANIFSTRSVRPGGSVGARCPVAPLRATATITSIKRMLACTSAEPEQDQRNPLCTATDADAIDFAPWVLVERDKKKPAR